MTTDLLICILLANIAIITTPITLYIIKRKHNQ